MSALVPLPRPGSPGLRSRLWCGLALVCAMIATTRAPAQPAAIKPAAPGLSETGAPAFLVLSPSTLGLSAPPTDLQPLPDGRIVALAGRELAFGDGTRWEVFRLAPADRAPVSTSIAVDGSGQVHVGMPDAFARVDFATDGYWRRTPVAVLDQPETTPATVHAVAQQWYWHSGNGSVVAWRPGQTPVAVGQITDMERAVTLDGIDYLSDRADGALWRVTPEGLEPAINSRATNVSFTITCALDLQGGRSVVGTNGHGIQQFAAGDLQPFLTNGPLSGPSRINDLCATVPGLFAAAVDNVGIVFFDREGRTVQVLDRTLDYRLSRVRRLFYMRHGAVWALLNDGIVRVEFPSRISHYEPMVSTGLGFAQPYRLHGRLWLLSDGQAQRGVYDHDGRLLRFEVDTPPNEFLCSLSTGTGTLLAGGRSGIFRRDPAGWALAHPGIINAQLCSFPDAEGRWLFFAENAVGWLRSKGDSYEVWTRPAPGVGGVYGVIGDGHGVLWAELGAARVGRYELSGNDARVELFGPGQGLAGGWAQLYLIGGEIRANVANKLLRFDPAQRAFVPDGEFARLLPEPVPGVLGRPGIDASGRLWLTTADHLQLYEPRDRGYRRIPERFPAGLLPLFFTPDDSGPVWLHQRLQLARYDPAMPLPEPGDPRVIITRVQLTGSNRTLFLPQRTIPTLPANENSFVVHFMAVDAPPAQTVTFEVRLEGASDDWMSTGVVGTAAFNRLKEGNYVLRIRSLMQGLPGAEARLTFAVEPPWFRSRVAYLAYGAAALAFIALVAWYAGWRERRDKARLGLLVAQRTQELNTANRQLAENVEATLRQADELRTSEERYRQLSTELERRVNERTEALLRANEQLVASNQELESFSYSISHDLRAPLRNINGFVDLLRRRNRGTLDAESGRFFQIIATETIRLSQLIDSLLAFARLNRADFRFEPVTVASLVTQVVAELRPEYENRILDWRIGPLPTVVADTALLRQVVANLLANAIKFTRHRQPAIIEIGAQPFDDAHLAEHIIFVRDNGAGFDPKYSAKLFGVFQRLHHTRDFEGTGIGLANAKRIITRHGGRIWAESTPGQGATFYFSLPVRDHGHP